MQAECLKFLHKPSASKMALEGAVIHAQPEEYVYTDSAYFFDMATAQRLLLIYHQIQPIRCEIDAYGDLLQALGPNATAEYTQNTANVTKVDEELVAVRAKLFELLKGTQLNVLAFNNSKFYHIGTIEEYLEHFSGDSLFLSELTGRRQVLVHRYLRSPREQEVK